MKPIIFLVISFIIFYNLSSQDLNKIDSIERLLEKESDVAERIDLYTVLSREYSNLDLDRSITIAEQALTLAKNIDNAEAAGNLSKLLGDFYLQEDNLDLAEEYYKSALPYLEQSNQYKSLIKTHIALGNRHNEKDNYPEAMNQYLMGIRYAENNQVLFDLPRLYNNLGVIYLKLNNPAKAVDLYTKALKLFQENGDTINIAGTTTNIGSIYLQLGDTKAARQYYTDGLNLFVSINHAQGKAHAMFKLGLLDIETKDFRSAISMLQQSIEIQNTIDVSLESRSLFKAETEINMGIAYLSLNEYKLADKYLKRGYKLALKSRQNSLIALAAEHLSEYYKAKKMFENSLQFYEVYKQYSDSLFNEDNIKKITRLEMQYQFEGKLRDAELKQIVTEQKRKRTTFIYATVSIGLLLVLTILFLLLLLEKNKKRKVDLEKKALSEKLEHTNKELTTYVMYLLRKNEFILSIIEKLKKARLDAKPENKKAIGELISELKSNTDTVSWEEFEVRFQGVHTDFYTKLREKFPDLTTNEIRLCAFFRLNMTTKEIAAITYQSLNSIKVARYRLRKKLKLNQQENLISFLSQF